MGGVDKGLVKLNGRPLIEHVIARIAPQVTTLVLSANRNLERYQAYGHPVFNDQTRHSGPLAGILCALQQCPSDWLLTVPCDTPYLPEHLVPHICEAAHQTAARCYTAHDGERLQPLISIIHRSLLTSLQAYLASGNRRAALWLKQQATVTVSFADQAEAFTNINTAAALTQCSSE